MRATPWAGLALLLAVKAASAMTVAEVQACMEANVPDAVRVQAVEVTSYDRAGGERVLRGRIFGTREKGLGRFMAQVEAPHDLARTAFLVREGSGSPETYLYVPSVNRVKRLAGNAMTGKLWGTDFSYNEFRQVQTAFAAVGARLDAPAQEEGRAVYVLNLKAAAGEPYDSIRMSVDQQACVPLKVEFRKADAVRKTLTVPVAQLKRDGTHWYPGEMELRDVVAGTHTRLRVLELKAVDKLSAGLFQPQQFYSSR